MADIELVIRVSEDTFEKIREFDGKHDVLIDRGELYEAIQNGTPLPKGHGRLIDADALYEDLIFPTEQFSKAFKEILDDAPTIIGADMRKSIGENIRCNTCVNNDDELSGECYECIKGIFDHYEPEEV